MQLTAHATTKSRRGIPASIRARVTALIAAHRVP
jgi:hypothetical protein